MDVERGKPTTAVKPHEYRLFLSHVGFCPDVESQTVLALSVAGISEPQPDVARIFGQAEV